MTVWDSLVGQESAVEVLQYAAHSARRIIQENVSAEHAHSMAHAWLITGPPGSGRSNAAFAFAAAMQCTGNVVGCGECPGCVTVLARTHADVYAISTEATQLRIEQVRDLVGRAQVAPSQGRWRIIIIEDADRMIERTSNVLLKAIEEPPERTVWLLCAPTAEDMITTIRSRCRHLSLRIPSIQSVAELLVQRDGIAFDIALEAARSAQSHIGLARALARNPQLRQRRREIMTAPILVRSVGEAVMAAHHLLETAKAQVEQQTEERNVREKTALLRQLGIEEKQRVAPALRSQVTQLEEEQKRRAKRALQDGLDRALLDILAIYRDVLLLQLGAQQELINEDLSDTITFLAQESSAEQTLARIEAIELARQRISANVAPLLALEAMVIALRPQHKRS